MKLDLFLKSRRFLVLAIVIACMMIVTACGGSNSTNSSESTNESGTEGENPDELPVVKISGLSGGLAPVFMKVMEEEGFDVKNGFKGEYQYPDADSATQSFLLGNSDVSLAMDVMGTAIARSQGHDPVVFYPSVNMTNSIIVNGDSEYQTPEELIGKRVGHFGADSGTTASIAIMLNEIYGIDVFKDYHLIEAGPPALVELLDQGEIDAMFNFDPNNNTALVNGARIIFSAKTDWDEYTGGSLWLTNMAASEKWLKENKELAYAVRDAYDDSYEWMSANYDALAEEPYKTLIGKEDPSILKNIVQRAKELPYFANSWTDKDLQRAEQFIDLMVEQGTLIQENPGGTVTTLEELLGPR